MFVARRGAFAYDVLGICVATELIAALCTKFAAVIAHEVQLLSPPSVRVPKE